MNTFKYIFQFPVNFKDKKRQAHSKLQDRKVRNNIKKDRNGQKDKD